MSDLIQFFSGAAGALLLSALIRTMPNPSTFNDNVWYRWFYDFSQAVLANFDKSGFTNGARSANNK